jgi:hypothetical protein
VAIICSSNKLFATCQGSGAKKKWQQLVEQVKKEVDFNGNDYKSGLGAEDVTTL